MQLSRACRLRTRAKSSLPSSPRPTQHLQSALGLGLGPGQHPSDQGQHCSRSGEVTVPAPQVLSLWVPGEGAAVSWHLGLLGGEDTPWPDSSARSQVPVGNSTARKAPRGRDRKEQDPDGQAEVCRDPTTRHLGSDRRQSRSFKATRPARHWDSPAPTEPGRARPSKRE